MIKHHYGQRWLAKLGIAGLTIGHHIFYAEDNPRLSTTLHEIEHDPTIGGYMGMGFIYKYSETGIFD